jgi:hypothetical protein
VRAGPAIEEPVDELVGRVELLAFQRLRQAEARGPGAIAFLERLEGAGDALEADGGDGRRPHRLHDGLARGHQVDALVEVRPEGAELAGLLGLDQGGDRLVDLLLGHVALVAILQDAHRLVDHGGVHDADRGDVEDRGLALELGIEQFRPALDRALDQVGPDAERVGVVGGRDQGEPLGRLLGELLAALLLEIHHLVRRRALVADLLAVDLALGDGGRQLVDQLHLVGVDRLEVAGGDQVAQREILGIDQVERIRLGDDALGDVVRGDGDVFDVDAGDFLGLGGDRRRLVGRGREIAQRDRLVGVHRREAGHRGGAEEARGDGGALQQRAAGNAALGLVVHRSCLLWLGVGGRLQLAAESSWMSFGSQCTVTVSPVSKGRW